jgi:hypothetical protein
VKAAITLGAATVLAALAFAAAPAQAEQGPLPALTSDQTANPLDVGWRYDTYYIYPLTRHLGMQSNWRFAIYPVTVVMDTAQLPFGAIAGLFGK